MRAKNYKGVIMKLNNVPVILFTVLLLVSCSPKEYFIDSDYAGKKITDAVLLVANTNDIKVYQDNGSFSESELDSLKENYLFLMNKNLKDDLKPSSSFARVGTFEFTKTPAMETASYNLDNGEEIKIYIPKNKIAIESENKVFILFLQDGYLHLKKNEKDTSDPAKHYSVSETPAGQVNLKSSKLFNNQFSFNTKFVIYDNNTGKVVSCGYVSTKQNFTQNNSVEEIIKNTLGELANKIVNGSPFEN